MIQQPLLEASVYGFQQLGLIKTPVSAALCCKRHLADPRVLISGPRLVEHLKMRPVPSLKLPVATPPFYSF